MATLSPIPISLTFKVINSDTEAQSLPCSSKRLPLSNVTNHCQQHNAGSFFVYDTQSKTPNIELHTDEEGRIHLKMTSTLALKVICTTNDQTTTTELSCADIMATVLERDSYNPQEETSISIVYDRKIGSLYLEQP